jgi:CRISPR-associated protein Csh1
MLNTLIEIGRQISEDRHPWEDFLLNVKISERDEEKNRLILRLVFDIDTGAINTEEGLKQYLPEKRADYGLIDLLKGNNKSIYVATETAKMEQLAKTLFGKSVNGKDFPEFGEFQEAIHKEAPDLKSSEFNDALSLIKPFGPTFYEKFADEKGKLVIKDVQKGNQDVLVAVYVAATSAARGWESKPLAKMEGFSTFIERKFLSSVQSNKKPTPKLCYASGGIKEDTGEPNFLARYNLNKIFQGTTINYAGNFDGKNLAKNYQLSEETRQYLDRGSEKILTDFQVKIGGLPHVCIPRLPMGSEYSIEDYRRLRDRTDLIFRIKDVKSVLDEMDFQADSNLYWLDFYGFESDGNFLKITNHIRDVSGVHIYNLLDQI